MNDDEAILMSGFYLASGKLRPNGYKCTTVSTHGAHYCDITNTLKKAHCSFEMSSFDERYHTYIKKIIIFH